MTGVERRLTGHWHLSVSILLIIPGLQIGTIFGWFLIGLIPGPLALKKTIRTFNIFLNNLTDLKIFKMIVDVSLFEHGSNPQGLLGS